MKKIYQEENVYDATIKRLEFIFNEFENVLVSFSGGKDSGVLLNLAYDYAKKNGMLEKLGMYYMDYEADYNQTDEFVSRTFNDNFPEIKKYRLCLPIHAQCSCSMSEQYWTPWEKSKQDIWVKQMPDSPYVINEDNCPFDFVPGTYGAETRTDFTKWFSKEYGKTAVLVGIRCDESLNRLAILTSTQRVNMYKGTRYSKKVDDLTYSFYPLYDWRTEDIWTANGKFGYDYNKAYDLMYMAGMNPAEMRIASPFHSCGQKQLSLYKAFSPDNWSRMVSRVNGVNFTAIYGGTTAMGWKNITKPDHFTWEQYANFLLSTLPEETREKYLKKIEKSKWHWRVQGGARSEEFIEQLEKEGVKVRRSGKTSASCKVHTEREVIYIDEMMDDTDVKEFRKAPSWKRVCIAIMKNDVACLYMGFDRNKEEKQRIKKTMEKYRGIVGGKV